MQCIQDVNIVIFFWSFDCFYFFTFIIVMINYSQVKPSPKLLLQFSRNQQIPKLVSIHDVKQKQNRNKLLLQARIQAPLTQPPPQSGKKQFNPDLSNLRHNLQGERQQNEQLRSSIKELTNELQKLREVNEGLIVRIKQVQNSYRLLKSEFESTCQDQLRKQRVEIYGDVQEYIQIAIQKLTANIQNERITPNLQDNLEKFMGELLEINSISTSQSKRSYQQQSRRQSRMQTVQRAQSRRVDTYLTRLSAVSKRQASKQPNNRQPSRQQYASIMQRLTGQNRMSKSFAGAGAVIGTVSQDTRFRTVYATTPQKRRKIFD